MPIRRLRIWPTFAFAVSAGLIAAVESSHVFANEHARPPPNILWITCEDISPNLGCYGDSYAATPNLDRFADESVRYTQAFATAGVCAPSRSSLITGMYANSLGTQHMRCRGRLPDEVKCFPAYLRKAGYYCTNNAKTDYNFGPPKGSWDDSSHTAHWRRRGQGQSFFAVFNFTSTHESRIFQSDADYERTTADLAPQRRHDPAQAPLPPYHPDTPETRHDWVRYYDMITVMDRQVGQLLGQLEDDGLTDDTIVFFFSDHGAGMPRSKRWLYDSGLHVPLLVRFPTKYARLAPGKPGTATERLVSLVDFAPTTLNLAGVDIPRHMQGTAFLGEQAATPREHVFGFRDRMDERYDLQRCVRDHRFKYIRNFRPDLPYFREQNLGYALQVPTLQVWQRLADAGKLTGPAATFMTPTKPVEELYDTQADPWEVHNLTADPEYHRALERLRLQLDDWMASIIDLGLLPEADLRTRFGNQAPYTAVRELASHPSGYPLQRIRHAADRANRSAGRTDSESIVQLATDDDPAVRFWAAVGLGTFSRRHQDDAPAECLQEMIQKKDEAPIVRVAVAEALCRLDEFETAVPVLTAAMGDNNDWVRLYAANVLGRIGQKAQPAIEQLRRRRDDPNEYVQRACRAAVENVTTARSSSD